MYGFKLIFPFRQDDGKIKYIRIAFLLIRLKQAIALPKKTNKNTTNYFHTSVKSKTKPGNTSSPDKLCGLSNTLTAVSGW